MTTAYLRDEDNTVKARLLLAIAMAFAATAASAQTLTTQQLNTLCAAVKADTTANAARVAGDTTALLKWLNGARSPQALAWSTAVSKAASDESPSYATYDSLAAGKRDSWTRFLDAPSRDYSKNKVRAWITDVWGAATASSNAEAILLAGTRDASNAQFALGGASKTTGTVTALDLTYPFAVPSSAGDWLVVSTNCT